MSEAAEQRKALEDLRLEQLNSDHACDHGAMERRAGMSHKGNVWAGWFCKADNPACDPEWADVRSVVMPALEAWRDGHET